MALHGKAKESKGKQRKSNRAVTVKEHYQQKFGAIIAHIAEIANENKGKAQGMIDFY